jgi:hypothetical protein
VIPGLEPYTEDEHEAITTPSGIQEIPPPPPAPVVSVPPKKTISLKASLWAGAICFGILMIAIAIATTVQFLVDMSWYGGGFYAAGVLLSSATLGALGVSAFWAVRKR